MRRTLMTLLVASIVLTSILYFLLDSDKTLSRLSHQTLGFTKPIDLAVGPKLEGLNLKIVPLGDSITAGLLSPTFDGYRQYLLDKLDGNQVDLIGCSANGWGRDNQHQGRGGASIGEIGGFVSCAFPSNANVYLLHAGTNDMAWSPDCRVNTTFCEDAAERLGQLVDVIQHFQKPLIVVAKIIPSGLNEIAASNNLIYNDFVEKMVNERNQKGTEYRLQLADMQAVVNVTDLADNVHPTDAGYKKMASVWYEALSNASRNNLIPGAKLASGIVTGGCRYFFPNFNVQPNKPSYSGRNMKNVFGGVTCNDIGVATCVCTDSTTTEPFAVTQQQTCKEMSLAYTSRVRWADLNGDGRQDNIYITDKGRLNVSINTNGFDFENPVFGGMTAFPIAGVGGDGHILSTFNEIGIKGPDVSTKPYQVRLGDTDGKGRADYFIVYEDGTVDGWYNLGSPRTKDNAIDVVFDTKSTQFSPPRGLSGVGVRLVDWDGDGRVDYVWVSAKGQVQVWLNKASIGTAVSSWISLGTVGPRTHGEVGREQVIIQDVNADGRADYLVVDRVTGEVDVYINLPPMSGEGSNWLSQNLINKKQAKGVGGDVAQAEVIFADVDGDGRYDYYVTKNEDSSVTGIKNNCY